MSVDSCVVDGSSSTWYRALTGSLAERAVNHPFTGLGEVLVFLPRQRTVRVRRPSVWGGDGAYLVIVNRDGLAADAAHVLATDTFLSEMWDHLFARHLSPGSAQR